MNWDLVRAELEAHPGRFSFFQAVRILEAVSPDRARVGGVEGPEREAIRFSSHSSIAFPATEIEELASAEDGASKMTVNFMGLVGPQGVLPLDYTVLTEERVRVRDTALRDFLDIFQHRIISLFYRAWLKHRFLEQRERGEEDDLTAHLFDLAGLGLPSHRRLPHLSVQALAGYTGLLAAQTRSAQALEQLLGDFFDVPVSVEQFVGDWYPVRGRDQCEIGDEGRASSRLGMGALAGDEIWDPQARVRVKLGPLSRPQYDALLPEGRSHASLRTLLRFFSHGEHEFEVQLVLDEEDVPALHVGADDSERLGWTTWLRTRRPDGPADQTIFRIDERDPQ
jgi:type VI secretion system protein ImpH